MRKFRTWTFSTMNCIAAADFTITPDFLQRTLAEDHYCLYVRPLPIVHVTLKYQGTKKRYEFRYKTK